MRLTAFRGCEHPALLDHINRLRRLVWIPAGRHLQTALAVDALDRSAINLACFQDDRLVGASQISVHLVVCTMRDARHYAHFIERHDFPVAVLNRLVVHPQFQGRRIAERMDARRLRYAARAGVRTIWVEARGKRLHALASLGFTECGPSLDERYPGAWRILCKQLS